MKTVSTSKAREDFATLVNEVAFGQERVVLSRRGKTVAAVISADDLALLEALEDRYDVEAARSALAEAREKGEESLDWGEALAELGGD